MSTVGLLTTCHTKVLHVTERSPFNLQLRFSGCNARSIVNCSRTSMLINKRRFSKNTFIDFFGGGTR